jgi:hypothetical protein
MPGLQLEKSPQDIYNAIIKRGLISTSTVELSLLIPFLYSCLIINIQAINKSCRFKYNCVCITDDRNRICVEQFVEVCTGICQ